MAAPQRRSTTERPVRRQSKERKASQESPKRVPRGGVRSRRAFVLLVVPVLLMLGSVYLHTVATEFGGEAARFEAEKARAEGEKERLKVRITELSEPGRIRTLAKENLGMQDPGGKDLRTYESDGEDVVNGGGENDKGTGE